MNSVVDFEISFTQKMSRNTCSKLETLVQETSFLTYAQIPPRKWKDVRSFKPGKENDA